MVTRDHTVHSCATWEVTLTSSNRDYYIFFRTTRPLASSEATAYYQLAPGQTDSIPERHQRQWIQNLGWYVKGTGRG